MRHQDGGPRRRVRSSLETSDVEEARTRRDWLFAALGRPGRSRRVAGDEPSSSPSYRTSSISRPAVARSGSEAMEEAHLSSSPPPRLLDVEGWRGFPVPHLWEPFHPDLSVRLDLSRGACVNCQFFEEYGTDSLDEALGKLAQMIMVRMMYSALPADRIADVESTVDPELLGGPWQLAPARHLFANELCWSLGRRGRAAPHRIERADRSTLWRGTHACHAFFMIERDWYAGPFRLIGGGASSVDCAGPGRCCGTGCAGGWSDDLGSE